MKRFQVIQGGKGQDKDTSGPPLRLYKAFSISNLTKGKAVYYGVRFNWYCIERDEPTFPYEELIAKYAQLEGKQRSLFERDVKRFFAASEIQELGEYLMGRYGMDLHAEEVELPMEERDYFFGEGSSVVYDFLELSKQSAYTLPFKVWGYYTLQHCMTSGMLECGIRFITKALQRLGEPGHVDREQLEAVCKVLYEEEGLFVKDRNEEP